ncbi:hypothetical protein LTR70_001290 [Exophiala xenobiotica]|uniref:F-box domain-containing protein n=1 Tax=Lithohypha guttulata TaxID=1690604 RepID=A0ABR0KKW7_9EURO|nr:hypothetical protein LTR24_001541 [Lithohypha guttulata]KAK5328265.1 hypothetical protein LTR70_001290 [Exophiala xenobiotica]
MTFHFSGRLCQREKPERGSLAKVSENGPPKGHSPILSLPAEVRAYIFKFLIDDVDLIFRFSKHFDTSSCWVSWQEYHQKLAFLRACKLFEAEALNLVQVQAIGIEVDPLPDQNSVNPETAKLFAKYKRSVPQPIGLRLETVRPYLIQLSIDSRYTLGYFLATDLLDSFPKLRFIRIKQVLWPRTIDSNYRETINGAPGRLGVISESVGEHTGTSPYLAQRSTGCLYDDVKLGTFLGNEKLRKYHPLMVDTTIRSLGRFPDDWPSDDEAGYPIKGAVSGLRMTYQWPARRVTSLEVDMYNQPMALAIKSQWTEKISLTDGADATIDGSSNNV